jgi:2-oxoglutarate ferredoxin oxidoreductase subunit beta
MTAAPVQAPQAPQGHPLDEYLRCDRMPHIWCPGCGLGTVLNCLATCLHERREELEHYAVVSGIGCTGRIAGYIKLDSFHTTHGRALPFATGLRLANPKLKVMVISGDGDLIAIGGNHFIHAARRNVDMTVICVNNLNYGMTGGQVGPTTPLTAITTTTPFGCIELPFNLPHLAAACGAVYVARWTVYHVHRLLRALGEAIDKRGFSFVEIISPCPTTFGRPNAMPSGPDMLKYYKEHGKVNNKADLSTIGIELGKPIVIGKFVDVERPTFRELHVETTKPAVEVSETAGTP